MHRILALLTILFALSGYSQNKQNVVLEENEILSRYLRGVYSGQNSNNIEGTPYLEDQFKFGAVVFNEKSVGAPIRYNVAREQMEVLFNDQNYLLQDGLEVKIVDRLYKKFEYKRDGKDYVGYFAVLTDISKSVVLLKKSFKKVRPGQAAGAMRPATSPRYVDNSEYYLKFRDSKPVQVENRKRKFLKPFPKKHQEEIKLFLKKNNYSPKNESDLVKIVNFYNQIFE